MLHRLLFLAGVVCSLTPLPALAQVVGSNVGSRWTTTSQTASAPSQGDPVTLTWGFARDGSPISAAFPGESSAVSSLIADLDAATGVVGGGSDYTTRPWFSKFTTAVNNLSAISGLTFVYEAADDTSALRGLSGQTGVRADMRIGAHAIDGGSNTLAYNAFPADGDMVIDNGDLGTGAGMAVRPDGMFVQTLMHELGHGVGLSHVAAGPGGASLSVPQLMEPYTSFPIPTNPLPQANDILALQRMYGDALEKSGGNDTLLSATNLGTLIDGSPLAIGTSVPDGTTLTEVVAGQTDFISIDGILDVDVFGFTVSQIGTLLATLDPRGATYTIGSGDSNGPFNLFDAASQNNLVLEILDGSGTVLGTSNIGGLDGTETIAGLVLGPGSYFARVSGLNDAAQFYRLDLSINASAVPEPSTYALLSLGALVLGYRIRRKRAAVPA